MNTTIHVISGILLFLFMSACATRKDIVYFQDETPFTATSIDSGYAVRIQKDDLLGITVNSKDPELAVPFNLPLIAYQAGKGEQLSNTPQLQGYLVDAEGNIEFPLLGQMHVEGLSRLELTKRIKEQLIAKDFLMDPVVNVKLLNYKIAVLGEVARPGTYTINSDRISVLDALSMAGDLTIYGKRDRVKIIREENGKRTIETIDLRSNDLFSSPYFYLQQNDVIYVSPNKSRIGQSTYNSNLPLLVSCLSVLISAILVFVK